MAQQRPHGTRRVWLPAAAFGLFAAAIGVRLVQLQVLEHDYYAAKAREELLGNDTIYAQRGTILDRNGGVLATSVTTWDIYVNVRVWKDDAAANKAAAELAPFLKTTPTALRALVSSAESLDARVYHDLSYEAGIELIKRKVPGVIALSNTARINPEGDVASSVLGFIGTENTGLAGIEAAYNEVLQGQPGRAIYERDTTGDPIPYGQHTVTQPKPGEDLVLTIDRVLQEMAEQYLADGMKEHRAKGGSIIVMDPMTGEILALATSPGLKFSSLEEDLSGGGDDALSLLRNRAVTDLYEPGSVMKIITAAAAIDAGVVGPNTEYVDTGIVYIENVPLKNWDDGSYGKQTMTGVLQNSINSGAVFMQQALGTKRFQQYLDAFGFGKPTGVDLQGEASGIFRRPEDDGYSPVDVATQSFGQSISVTPMQMMQAVAAAINGGNLIAPHVVKARIKSDGTRVDVPPQVVGRAISPQTSDTIRQMLGAVVSQDPDGWGRNPSRYTAGGKSGTANVPVWGTYDETQIVSFIGFAPLESPKILVLVKLDENGDGKTGTVAGGPIFAKFTDDALRYLSVRPEKGPSAVSR
ncbi:penicillin-binding protein 2 [Candidatus Amarobacter glycogenicus]|uniref:peptidoglycan D,D-transpeptidase FtsI family protein n=1 Tax=Candidatus Amarobacter glycogenicus TaxID=3140699 RepID=UPI0031349DC6|nr:penicillin-binding protein 2 [Dehalococcoidia bacterium]